MLRVLGADDVMTGLGMFQKDNLKGTACTTVLDYTGEYRANLRHGSGKAVYANRDVFDGLW